MFGTNQITGKKYFADAPEDSLLVTSMFFTIQGEGPYMGEPAYFFRLTKCNLNCSFCDAMFEQGEYYSHRQLINMMESEVPDYFKRNANYTSLVVITGGEPFLQDIEPFVILLMRLGYRVQIETNGLLSKPSLATVVCSPKCSEKTGKYLNLPRDYEEHIDCLKFVVSADPASPYHKIPDWAFDFDAEILLSPMNVYKKMPDKFKGTGTLEERSTKDEVVSFWDNELLDAKANQANHVYAARYAMEIGARLNLQMHVYCDLA